MTWRALSISPSTKAAEGTSTGSPPSDQPELQRYEGCVPPSPGTGGGAGIAAVVDPNTAVAGFGAGGFGDASTIFTPQVAQQQLQQQQQVGQVTNNA
jgi:hypothetical protein